ncbi:MAG: hypothetical protein QM811_12750 [Pirellulales bacterium]
MLASNAPQPVVDLSLSGNGPSNTFGAIKGTSLMLTFHPSGQVERLYYTDSGGTVHAETPVSTLFFFVRLRLEEGTQSYGTNDQAFKDPNGYWVAVNPFTGAITVSDVVVGTDVKTSRTDAIKNQTTGTL